ncbi:MAG: sensor histidine kinase [Candidatus Thiodiazotropha taylori]|nr:sensor histidine kinase [Candidatus Thiodiazotropha taylori]MCG7958641.1 sensor histidine kinase [Candidatus Thiodiazotropha taylori]MCW4232202.1 sensor histidine kinase [Candidatus Thiodiazotropha taylori]MCW4244245.1 sensor histidine kinase [Candidatus Thiodiazotropha taylori]
MALVNDHLGSDAFLGVSALKLSSSPFPSMEKDAQTGVSINDNLRLTDQHIKDGLSCLKQLKQGAHHQHVSSEELERKRISRELHDGLGQLLTSMSLHVQRCLDGCDGQEKASQSQQRESLEAVSSMVKQAMSEVRSICSAIRPAILDDLGVIPAISWQCRQITKVCSDTQVVTDFDVDEESIPEDYKSVIYRIVQESLNNAVKYAKAKTITVSLLQAHDAIHLLVIDNGVGFDPSEIQGNLGMGLVGMRERAESVDGRIRIDTGIDQGVQIRASFPL